MVGWQYGALYGTLEINVAHEAGARPFTRRVTSIKTLVSTYYERECRFCPEHARLTATRGREFFYRNTRGQLDLDIDFKEAVGEVPSRTIGSVRRDGLVSQLQEALSGSIRRGQGLAVQGRVLLVHGGVERQARDHGRQAGRERGCHGSGATPTRRGLLRGQGLGECAQCGGRD